MPQNYTQAKIRGLQTFNSDFTQNQSDFLSDCNNIVLNRDNIAEPRRGLQIYGNEMGGSPTTDIAKQLIAYKARILRHYGAGSGTTLEFDDGTGNFTAFDGSYAETSQGTRIKSTEANGNLYFTTSTGIKKISAATSADFNSSPGLITNSGGVKALDLTGNLDYSQTGFFTQNSTVAYRVVWGIKDVNGNLILGVPSSRLVLQNPLTGLLVKDFNDLLHGLDAAAAVNTGTLQDTNYYSLLHVALTATPAQIYTELVALCTKLDADMGGTTYTTIATGETSPGNNPTSDQLVALQGFYDSIVSHLLTESLAHITVLAQTAGNFQNSTQSCVVDIQFTIPEQITSNSYFYQVYRTAVSQSVGPSFLSDLDPGDEQGLVYEANTTPAQRALGLVTLTDIVPESFRGANLYTNPQSGEGILQANEVPPVATDVALFMNSTFYSNTKTKHQLPISLLGVGNFVSGTSSISIIEGATTNTYTFSSTIAQLVEVTFVPGANYLATGTSDYFDIFSGLNATRYRVWFQFGSSTAPSSKDVTLVQITLTGSETASAVATLVHTALTGADFTITQSTNTLSITNTQAGTTNLAVNHVADPGFAVATLPEGTGTGPNNKTVLLSSAATPAQKVDETARSLVRVINLNANESVYAFYLSGPSDLPGKIQLETRTLGTTPFYVLANSASTGASFSPSIAPTNFITSITAANPAVVTSTAHGLSNEEQILVVNSNSTPVIDGIQIVAGVTTNTFTVPVHTTVSGNTGAWIALSSAQVSSNNVSPNRIYFSKFQQPEAVPIVNFFDVGPKDSAIIRILALRDALVVLKEDAVWLVTGADAVSGFTSALFDSSTRIAACDSAVVLNNQIFVFTNQGISTITSTGVSIVSRAIENLLIPLLIQTNFSTATFGVSYESDRAYLLWTTTSSNDTVATECFRYNTFENSWTKWDISKTCGVVLKEMLYLGAGDTNFIEVERKNFNRTDYADRQFSKTLAIGSVNGTIVNIGSTTDTVQYDVLYQEQYLTIYKLNQLLSKLDTDKNTEFHNYSVSFAGSVGQNLRDNLTSLAAQLDTDTGVNNSTFSSGISGYTDSFSDTQLAFNYIANTLNSSSAGYKNYPLSTGTTQYESMITSVNTLTNFITTKIALPLIAGPALVYQHIPIFIQFNPQFFGDPELLKQVSEAKFIFDRTNFSTATISYSSDLSPSFEAYPFTKQGNGSFGNDVFGETNFGGNGDKTPLRTLVPRNKQRCRFLVPKIEHTVAREKMSVIGYSMFFTSHSPRAYAK